MKTSRLTVTANTQAAALLACEGIYLKMLTARYTVTCPTNSRVTKLALNAGAAAISRRQMAAELPFLVTPADLLSGLTKLGFTDEVAADAVAQVSVVFGIRDEAEQHGDDVASQILTSHIANVPHLSGVTIHPTPDADREAVLAHEAASAETAQEAFRAQEEALAELRNPPESPVTDSPVVQS